jgi:hypothetical protein
MEKNLVVLELEEKLLEDRSGDVRRELLARLQAIQDRLAAQRRLLNDRQRYLEIQASMQAVTSAISVIRTVFVDRSLKKS